MSANSDYIKPNLERILVVISPDLVKPSAPLDSALLNRAIAVAQATNSELEILHVCHDPKLESPPMADDEVRLKKQKMVDHDATLIAELVLRMNTAGVRIRHDVRWDHPRTDAILRKIHEAQPDLVMKQSRDYDYVMGLLSNTDWDLIRQSPAHVWFVTDSEETDIRRMIAAVGSSTDKGTEELIAETDYDVFRLANLIAESFGATTYPVHTYQVPQRLGMYAAYAPERVGLANASAPIATFEEQRRTIASEHDRSITAFASYFQLNPERVQIAEGHPRDVLPEVAASMDADLIVMGARNLSRWERLFSSVSAEPVLAKTPCDVLFVKHNDNTRVPVGRESAVRGEPAFDLEQAITDPQRTFGTPERIAEATDISVALRAHILRTWEQDIRAQMAEENEGGPVKVTNVDLLDEISSASDRLNNEARQRDRPTQLGATTS